MKRLSEFFVLLALVFSSCATNTAAMVASFSGETDIKLASDCFPVVLKAADALSAGRPKSFSLAVTDASLCVMYANAFLQREAEMMGPDMASQKHAQLDRAKSFYIRGRDKALSALDRRHEGMAAAFLSGDESLWQPFLSEFKKKEVDAIFWLCSGWLGAFSLNPLDADMISTVPAAISLLETAARLDADYNSGAIWDVLTSVYAAIPAEMGGNREKAIHSHVESMRASGGKKIGPYLTYISAFCIPQNDSKGFDEYIEKALSIDPNADESDRLQTVMLREKALWLKARKDDLIIDWGDFD